MKRLNWKHHVCGVAAMQKRHDCYLIGELFAGLRASLERGVTPESAVRLLYAEHELGKLPPEAMWLFTQVGHLTEAQIKRRLLKMARGHMAVLAAERERQRDRALAGRLAERLGDLEVPNPFRPHHKGLIERTFRAASLAAGR